MIYALLSRNFVVEITHFFRKILGLGSRICKLFRFLDVWMTGRPPGMTRMTAPMSPLLQACPGTSGPREKAEQQGREFHRGDRPSAPSLPAFVKPPCLTTHPYPRNPGPGEKAGWRVSQRRLTGVLTGGENAFL